LRGDFGERQCYVTQQWARTVQQAFACVCQRDTARGAGEQNDAQLLLEHPHGVAADRDTPSSRPPALKLQRRATVRTRAAAKMGPLATSLTGPTNVTRAVLPIMRKQRSGHLVAISSSAGRVGFEFCSAYAASKFRLEGCGDPAKLTRALVTLVERAQPPFRFLAGADCIATAEQKVSTLSSKWLRFATGRRRSRLITPARATAGVDHALDDSTRCEDSSVHERGRDRLPRCRVPFNAAH